MAEPRTPKAAKRRSRANLIAALRQRIAGSGLGLRLTNRQLNSMAKQVAISSISRARRESHGVSSEGR